MKKMIALFTLLTLLTVITLLSSCLYYFAKNMGSVNLDTRPMIELDKPTVLKNVLLPVNTEVLYYSDTRKKEQNIEEFRVPPYVLKYEDRANPQFYIQWGGAYVNYMTIEEGQVLRVSTLNDVKMPNHNEFLRLWGQEHCEGILFIKLKNTNDWSFNPKNMYIEDCGLFTYPENARAKAEFLQRINQALQKLPAQLP